MRSLQASVARKYIVLLIILTYHLQVNCIVFDKTGTLTVGKPVVVSTKLLKNMVLMDFYELVAATEVCFSSCKQVSTEQVFSFCNALTI